MQRAQPTFLLRHPHTQVTTPRSPEGALGGTDQPHPLLRAGLPLPPPARPCRCHPGSPGTRIPQRRRPLVPLRLERREEELGQDRPGTGRREAFESISHHGGSERAGSSPASPGPAELSGSQHREEAMHTHAHTSARPSSLAELSRLRLRAGSRSTKCGQAPPRPRACCPQWEAVSLPGKRLWTRWRLAGLVLAPSHRQGGVALPRPDLSPAAPRRPGPELRHPAGEERAPA